MTRDTKGMGHADNMKLVRAWVRSHASHGRYGRAWWYSSEGGGRSAGDRIVTVDLTVAVRSTVAQSLG